jgi:hypothetical protein
MKNGSNGNGPAPVQVTEQDLRREEVTVTLSLMELGLLHQLCLMDRHYAQAWAIGAPGLRGLDRRELDVMLVARKLREQLEEVEQRLAERKSGNGVAASPGASAAPLAQ